VDAFTERTGLRMNGTSHDYIVEYICQAGLVAVRREKYNDTLSFQYRNRPPEGPRKVSKGVQPRRGSLAQIVGGRNGKKRKRDPPEVPRGHLHELQRWSLWVCR